MPIDKTKELTTKPMQYVPCVSCDTKSLALILPKGEENPGVRGLYCLNCGWSNKPEDLQCDARGQWRYVEGANDE